MKKEERKRVTKRIFAVLMAVLMVLPGNLDGILADDNNSTKAGLPGVTAYAAKEQLMNSFTPDSNGTAVNIGKLIFGKNSDGDAQEWYILGKDSGVSGDNTVIFASSPIIKSGQIFSYDTSDYTKTYNYEAGTGYGDSAGSIQVDVNHYGASELRSVHQDMVKSGNNTYFSETEQNLMNVTTVTTYDSKNNHNYTTSDKLYAPSTAGTTGAEKNITVGSNDDKKLNTATYWDYYSSNVWFWLRKPCYSASVWYADTTYKHISIGGSYPSYPGYFGIRPASNLNLSDVLFASAAKSATSETAVSGIIASDTAMTLRLDGNSKNIGSVFYNDTSGNIKVSKGSAENVALVVQGNDGTNDWYYSKQITGSDTVTVKASDIMTELNLTSDIDLSVCKIWLETTENNMAYVVPAEKINISYMTKEQLMNSFTPNSDGTAENIGKLIFGKNSDGDAQEWYILGKDNGVSGDNTVIFASSTIRTEHRFNYNTWDYIQTYSYEGGTGYGDGAGSIQVYVNHYGASELRSTLQDMVKSGNNTYFSETEQNLMNITTVITNDTMNGCNYTTSDKLYVPSSTSEGFTGKNIRVGSDDGKGLFADTYWNDGNWFWLRSPDEDSGNVEYYAYTSYNSVGRTYVNCKERYLGIRPVSNLNLSDVLFASAAKSATSDTEVADRIASDAAMTLRLDGSRKNIGTAIYNAATGEIKVSRGSNDGNVSLVVQGDDGANDCYYSKQITGSDTVSVKASDISSALNMTSDIDLSSCKIWLETTEDNVIYAVQAEKEIEKINTTYVTKEQLMNSFTPYSDGNATNIGKLSFGKNSAGNSQEWYILGKDDGVTGDNTVIFAASPLKTGQVFNEWDLWNEDGQDLNYYESSQLRKVLQDMASSDNNNYFSYAEQHMMNNTTVTTNVPRQSTTYTTTDKLYALTGDKNDNQYIWAGSSNDKKLAMTTYWNNGEYFWLRTPNTISKNDELIACPGYCVESLHISVEYEVRPAANLNLSGVIFASAATVATSEDTVSGRIASDAAMALRFEGNPLDVGSVTFNAVSGEVKAVKRDASDNVALVIQGNDGTDDWYYSKQITGLDTVTVKSSDIKTALNLTSDIDLSACAIWIETTEDNLIRAVQAEAANEVNICYHDADVEHIFGIEYNKDMTIAELNQIIYNVTGIDTDKYQLKYEDTILENDKTLQDYGIQKGSIINVNQIIDRIEAAINLPKGGEKLSTQITCNTANIASASLNWIGDYGDRASYYPYTYKAHMTFTPAAGYIVTDATEIIVNESTLSDNKTVNADGTITITKDYPSTKDKIIKVIPPTVPSDNTFAEYYTADSIIFSNNEVFNDELGEYAGFLSEGAPLGFEHSLRVIWYIDGTYDETPGAENTFIWKNFDDLSNYEVDSSCKTSGTVKIKNKAATPVTITGTDSSISFNGSDIDVSQYFTIDENAGTPTYSIISDTEDGSVTGKGNLDGSTLTVTKTGTIKVKLTTSANGNYAAGEATITLTISNGTIQDYTASDYSGTYDGQAHSIDVSVTNPAGTKITYGEDGINYSEENPKYTDAGEYTVYYKIEKANYDTIKGSKTVNISRKDVTITAGNQSVVWNHNIDQTKYKVSGLAGGDSITDITLTPSTSALTDNGIITVSNAKIGNRKDVTHSYNILVVNGRLEITHDTTLAPTGINAIKTKQSYKEGDILNVDDIIVTANYADGYSENVTEFTTNASDIDMNIAGNKTLTVSYTKNGGTKTCDIIINVVHVHKFDGAIWKSDGINHWKECTIAHCDKSDGYRIDETAHTYIHTYIWSGDNKKCTATGKCEICEYTDSETVDTTATVTQSKNCTRPELTKYTATFKNAHNNGFEEQVRTDVMTASATGHNMSEWISNGDDTHSKKCKNPDCTYRESGDCVGGTASYFKKAICDACGAEYGSLITDITNPTGEITVSNNRWNSLLNTITFGHFFKETQKVTITGNDDSYNSEGYDSSKNAVKISYLLVSGIDAKAYTTDELAQKYAEGKFKEYASSFNIATDDRYVVFARIEDFAGNATYISTDGMIVDTIAPVVDGITEGNTYCINAKFTVSDENIDKVTDTTASAVTTITAIDGVYTLSAGTHKIIVSDKAGNSTVVNVTVNGEHSYSEPTYTFNADNTECTAERICQVCQNKESETVDTTATVTQSKNCTRPELTTYKAVFTNPYFAEQTMENVETAPATGHISSDWILDKPATIKESGSRHKECIVCGETLEVEEIEKLEQVAYEIINGTDSKWVENSESSIVISGNGELAKFTGVKVDGELIDSTNYIATEGSTIITLKADYLKTLSVGSHSFEIVWEDGMASTNFNVVKKTSDNDHNNGNNDNNDDDNDNNNNGNDNNNNSSDNNNGNDNNNSSGNHNGNGSDNKHNNSSTNAGDNKNNNANSNTNQAGLPGNKKNDLSDTKGNHQSTTPAKTGDSTNLTLWITLLMASIAGITGIFTRRKKKNCK